MNGNGIQDACDTGISGVTGPITLTCGECDNTIDAGLIKTPTTATIGDFVFYDANHNGIQCAGETGIGGITVKLLNASGTTTLAATSTNSSGLYQFSNLTAGSYVVQFVIPGSYTLSPALCGSDTSRDSNASTSAGKTGVITVAAGQTDLTIDAGMYRSSSSGCGGRTCYNNSGDGSGGGYSGGSQNSGYSGSSNNGCSPGSSSGGGQYSGGGNWGCGGWNGSGWTNGSSASNCGPGELQSVCGNVQQVEFTNCGGKLYAHIHASPADCNAGRKAIQDISFNCSGSQNVYLGQQVGSLCLTGYTGSHGSAYTNW